LPRKGLFYNRCSALSADAKDRAMSWNEAMEQADKIQIEGPTPHRVRAWADAIHEALSQ